MLRSIISLAIGFEIRIHFITAKQILIRDRFRADRFLWLQTEMEHIDRSAGDGHRISLNRRIQVLNRNVLRIIEVSINV